MQCAGVKHEDRLAVAKDGIRAERYREWSYRLDTIRREPKSPGMLGHHRPGYIVAQEMRRTRSARSQRALVQ
jgi:hypothetical protein